MAKTKYFNPSVVSQMAAACQPFLGLRNQIYNNYGVDPLDTDTLSSLEVYKIVSQYDPAYNINFARNGEDAISNGVEIEQKCTKVQHNLTKKGRPRKNAGTDAGFQFHAMGDLQYPRYILVVRFKHDLSIDRLYDISDKNNVAQVQAHLLALRQAWLTAGQANAAKMKRDAIVLQERWLLSNLQIPSKKTVNNCTVFIA